MFVPSEIYYEKAIKGYDLGIQLLRKYSDVPQIVIENHNNIDVLRNSPNSDFTKLKKKLIIGIRKTHRYEENHKVSDFLVPYTSSGCTAACLYCYLVCHYNKCSYLRLFVNREQMLQRLIKTAEESAIKDVTFEIGSNSDLVLENTITGNLVWTIENFTKSKRGFLTFPTKFDMVDPILNINGTDRVIVRVSVNPEKIINMVEFGTSKLNNRIRAINKLKAAGYKVGIIIAPVILLDDWKTLYDELLKKLSEDLSDEVKKSVFFEVIFMTYSFVHNAINKEAFPNAFNIYNPELMTGRGMGKYAYKSSIKDEAKVYIKDALTRYFGDVNILYMT